VTQAGGGERGGERRGRGAAKMGLALRPYGEKCRTTRRPMEIAHRRRKPSPEPRRNPSIDGEPEVGSTNRKHQDRALDKTNATVLSDFANDARIESNCSPELELPRTLVSNFGNCGSNLGKRFSYLERDRRENFRHIYISRGSIYFIFQNKSIFKIKIIPKKAEIVFNFLKNISKVPKILVNIPSHDLTPDKLKKHI
jgi:hypothetical protein